MINKSADNGKMWVIPFLQKIKNNLERMRATHLFACSAHQHGRRDKLPYLPAAI